MTPERKNIEIKDGIWPMIWSDDLRTCVHQCGRRDWRWSIFYGHFGLAKTASGKATSRALALAAARENGATI